MSRTLGFKEYHSIEFSRELADFCTNRFKDRPEVHIYQGESYMWLEKILPKINKPTTFWLDAHEYDGVFGEVRDPLIKELKVLNRYPEFVLAVLIDDRRVLGNKKAQWNETSEVQVLMELKMLNMDITVADSKNYKQDIIIGVRR